MSDGDSEDFKKFFQTAAEGGWRLLQHYMCGPTRGFRSNQRGNGLAGIHCARNSHRVIPLHAFHGTSWQSGKGVEKNSAEETEEDDERKCPPKPVVIQMVSPAQQTTEQAKSNLKRQAEGAKKSVRPPTKKRKKISFE